jgi:hypothetical protein
MLLGGAYHHDESIDLPGLLVRRSLFSGPDLLSVPVAPHV